MMMESSIERYRESGVVSPAKAIVKRNACAVSPVICLIFRVRFIEPDPHTKTYGYLNQVRQVCPRLNAVKRTLPCQIVKSKSSIRNCL